MKPVVNRVAAWYQGQVGTELRKYGLRYEDLLDPMGSLASPRPSLHLLDQVLCNMTGVTADLSTRTAASSRRKAGLKAHASNLQVHSGA